MELDFVEANGGFEGKVAAVTGANSGLGFETTRRLAELGFEVVMGCRSRKRAEKARNKIERELRDPDLRIIRLDLADLNSINDFARRFNENYERLDLMVNNAGVMHIPFRRTEFGFEYQFGVNHLGHFALNSQLVDLLKDTDDSRVVSVSSLLHRRGDLDFGKLNSKDDYNRRKAYADSKLANLLYSRELEERFREKGTSSISVCAHPGYANTNLQIRSAEMSNSWIKKGLAKMANKVVAQSSERGALPVLYASLEDLEGGEFVGPSGFREIWGEPEEVEPDERADNRELRKELWEYSEEQLGMSFDI